MTFIADNKEAAANGSSLKNEKTLIDICSFDLGINRLRKATSCITSII